MDTEAKSTEKNISCTTLGKLLESNALELGKLMSFCCVSLRTDISNELAPLRLTLMVDNLLSQPN